jgi:hypothetical protein
MEARKVSEVGVQKVNGFEAVIRKARFIDEKEKSEPRYIGKAK